MDGKAILFYCLLGLFPYLPSGTALGLDVRSALSFKAGIEYDDNLFEGVTDRAGGLRAKIYLNSDISLLDSQSNTISMQCQIGLKNHLKRFSQDSLSTVNPFVGSINLHMARRIAPGAVIGAWGRLKNRCLVNSRGPYVSTEDGYLQRTAELFLVVGLSRNLNWALSYRSSLVDFKAFSMFDFSTEEEESTLDMKLPGPLRTKITVLYRKTDFERASLRLEKIGDDLYLRPLSESQRDRLWQVSIGLGFYKDVWVKGGYSFLDNNSNSYGYSFQAHRFSLLLARVIRKDIVFQLYSTVQLKRYSQSLRLTLPLTPRPERVEDDLLVARLSRDISEHCTVTLQYGFYRSESSQRGRYYTRNSYSLGLTLF